MPLQLVQQKLERRAALMYLGIAVVAVSTLALLVPFTREERTEAESTAVLAAAPLAVKASLE